MTETLILGGRQFTLRPLTLGQLRGVLDALDAMAGKSGGGLIEAAARLVAAGLAPSHPDLNADAVLDLEATVDDLNAAVAAILAAAGLKPQETPPGEARAPDGRPRPADPGMAISGGSSANSTPPSPPVAATPTP